MVVWKVVTVENKVFYLKTKDGSKSPNQVEAWFLINYPSELVKRVSRVSMVCMD